MTGERKKVSEKQEKRKKNNKETQEVQGPWRSA